MGLLDQAAAATDAADLMILANVETIRDQMQPATASAVASLIGGAPSREVGSRLVRMARMGLLDINVPDVGEVQLTAMGAELLDRELIGWSPSKREQRRREATLLSAAAGAYRQRS